MNRTPASRLMVNPIREDQPANRLQVSGQTSDERLIDYLPGRDSHEDPHENASVPHQRERLPVASVED